MVGRGGAGVAGYRAGSTGGEWSAREGFSDGVEGEADEVACERGLRFEQAVLQASGCFLTGVFGHGKWSMIRTAIQRQKVNAISHVRMMTNRIAANLARA